MIAEGKLGDQSRGGLRDVLIHGEERKHENYRTHYFLFFLSPF